MERKKALAFAGAAVVSLAAATGAVAANVGLLGFTEDDTRPTGQLQADQVVEVDDRPTTTLPDIVVTVDEVGSVTASSVPGSTVSGDDDGTPDQGSGDAPGTFDDDEFDDHDDELDDHDEDDELDEVDDHDDGRDDDD